MSAPDCALCAQEPYVSRGDGCPWHRPGWQAELAELWRQFRRAERDRIWDDLEADAARPDSPPDFESEH